MDFFKIFDVPFTYCLGVSNDGVFKLETFDDIRKYNVIITYRDYIESGHKDVNEGWLYLYNGYVTSPDVLKEPIKYQMELQKHNTIKNIFSTDNCFALNSHTDYTITVYKADLDVESFFWDMMKKLTDVNCGIMVSDGKKIGFFNRKYKINKSFDKVEGFKIELGNKTKISYKKNLKVSRPSNSLIKFKYPIVSEYHTCKIPHVLKVDVEHFLTFLQEGDPLFFKLTKNYSITPYGN
jgi:hypothetical protein